MPANAEMIGRTVQIDGILTHYFEGGLEHKSRRPSILLLHGAEPGGCAHLSWERNLPVLSAYWHVLAPDHLGFGGTDKIFDFRHHAERRVRHVRRFIETMGVARVHAVGSSMSGGLCLNVAARSPPDWPMASVVCCSGGGEAPDNEARRTLNGYDGSIEHMRRIVNDLFVDPQLTDDEAYVERRWLASREPGAWEVAAATKLKAPFAEPSAAESGRAGLDYGAIAVPTLVFAGRHDRLRNPGYTDHFVPKIPDARLHVFESAGHLGNIERADEFNAAVMVFLEGLDAKG